MNRILVFIGIASLVVLFSNVNLVSIDFIDAPVAVWVIGGILFYSIFIRKGDCSKRCAKV